MEAVSGWGGGECYLSSAKTNHQVGDEGVLRLSRAVAHHHAPAVLLGQLTPEGNVGLKDTLTWVHLNCLHLTLLHDTVCTCTPTQADIHSRLDGLGNGSNLVDFEQEAVAGFVLHSFLYPARVGHG